MTGNRNYVRSFDVPIGTANASFESDESLFFGCSRKRSKCVFESFLLLLLNILLATECVCDLLGEL